MDFRFLNDQHFDPPASGTPAGQRFTRFPDFPTELRLRIWELALPRRRLLTLGIAAGPAGAGAGRPPQYEARNALGNVVSGAGYLLRMRSTGSVSPLLRVSREAKDAVCGFYRVRVPVDGRGGSGAPPPPPPPCVRFCPETDTVHLQVEGRGHDGHFADVVHDALAWDPLGRGILHMAIGGFDVNAGQIGLPLDPLSTHGCARAALSSTLSNLHSVSLIHISKTDGRKMFTCLNYGGVRFNRCMPVWSTAASIAVLPSDPRPIDRDSKKLEVCLGFDPCMLICAWRALEAAFSVHPAPAARVHVLAAAPPIASPEVRGIASREEACRFRAAEEAHWERNFKPGGIYQKFGHGNPDTDETLERASKSNAVGFWVLPLEMFGDAPEVQYNMHNWETQAIVNLTGMKPQLGLFELPGEAEDL